ncbi:oligosaccharide flippase family protein [Vibrio misgurnus]|uniref:oligosaccharide flippase family protein n=1 Tax=Vibrio TaxID=662 RepID=UPI00241748A1|nr:oligosaccharide flippase family protein [Vibrio sp. gvc]
MIGQLLRYAPVQVFSALSVFLLIAIQTRFLTPENYGLLAVSMVVLELVRAFTTQWLNTSMLRLYPIYSAQEQQQLVQSISLTILFGGLVGFVVIAFALYANQQLNGSLLSILCLLLSVKSLFQYQLELARLNERLSAYRQAILLQSISVVVLSLGWLAYSATIESALLSLTLSYGIGALIFGLPSQPKLHRLMLKRLFAYGIPIMLAGGIGVIGGRIDRLFIAHISGMQQTGIYAAQANLLAGVLGLVFMVIALPLYPNLAKVSADRSVLQHQHQTYLHLLLTLTVPAVIGLGLLQQPLIKLLLGEQYMTGSPALFWVLALAVYTINFKAHYLEHGLQFLLQPGKLLWISLIGLTCSILLLPSMLHRFGIFGAALTLLMVSVLLASLVFLCAWRAGYRYSLGSDGIKVLIAAAVMGGYLFQILKLPLSINPLLALSGYIVSSIAVYGLSLWLFNPFKARQRLTDWWRKS